MTRVADKTAEKAQEKTKEAAFEEVLAALEERVEGLGKRMRELLSENARLKGAAADGAAEREKLKKELQDLRSASSEQVNAAERLEKLEAEREEVRTRIERLLSGLEQAEAGPDEP